MLVFVPGALELSGDKLVVITLRLRVSLPLRRVSLRTALRPRFLVWLLLDCACDVGKIRVALTA